MISWIWIPLTVIATTILVLFFSGCLRCSQEKPVQEIRRYRSGDYK